MSMWYHRNNFKSTTPSKFEIKLTHQNGEAIKICSDLRESRKRLLTLLPDPSAEVETIQTAFSLYLSLVHGFIASIGSNAGPSKLRHNFMFKWTHSLLGTVPQIQMDMVFEVANMFCNVAIWYMKHAAFIAAKEGITMDQAKEVYKSLRTAAGMFSFVIKVLVPLLTEKPKEGGDLDPRVLKAYMDQCIAEAQEVTVARAIELKHKPSLISPLAHQTSSLFASAAKEIAPIKEAEKWRKYLLLKCELYLAYAFNYYGANLLELDKCGLAIRVLKECQACHSRSEQLCKEYGKIKGSGSIVKPESHPFFRKLSHITKLTLDKCERENGLIYHHRIPDELPELELKADYGLVQPDDFVLPSPSPLWTESSYDVMVQLGGPSETKVSNAEAKLDSYLPPVKEVNIPQSTSEPKTHSGCSIQ